MYLKLSPLKISALIWLLSISSLIIAPWFGLESVSWHDIFLKDSVQSTIFWEIRLPRVLMAWCVGAVLAICGMCLQAILQNPLAEPFTLGIASSSALGASLYIHLGLNFAIADFAGLSIMAFIFAISSSLFIFTLSQRRAIKHNSQQNTQLLLMGLMLSFFCSAIIMLLQSIGEINNGYRLMRWMMGAIELTSFSTLAYVLPFWIIGIALIVLLTPRLNLLALGENLAKMRGLNTRLTTLSIYLICSLLLSLLIAFCGPIGFIGLIVPHAVRQLLGQDHRFIWQAILALGGGLLVIADTFARTVISPAELPVGVMTSMIGAPIFFALLLKNKSYL